GYVKAQKVRPGDEILLRQLQQGDDKRISRKKMVQRPLWISSKLFHKVPSRLSLHKDKEGQSNEKSKHKAKSIRNFKKNWSQAKNYWRKWSRTDKNTKNIIIRTSARMVSRICGGYRQWVSTLSLQNRYRKPNTEDCDRSRWRISRDFESEKGRQKEGKSFDWQRVESVEVFKQKNTNGVERSIVYNIEVDSNNNYFANNILVHNCHARNSDKLFPYFRDDARILGFTATPSRMGNKDQLGELYQAL